jgi:hypothetical protein
MTGKRRQNAGDDSAEETRPDDADANLSAEETDRNAVRPVRKKIGEGDKNLRDREAALSRRRGGDKDSS